MTRCIERDTAPALFKETLRTTGSAYGENFMHFDLGVGNTVTITNNHVKRVIVGPAPGKYFSSKEEVVLWCTKIQARRFPMECIGWLTTEGKPGQQWKRYLRPAIQDEG